MLEPTASAAPAKAEELEDVPVFPLPRVVFFPHTHLPLHFFEPRYRAMVRHCLENGPRLIAVVQLAPGWEADYEGQPDLRPVAGLGRIVAEQARPDGTFDVMLHGLERVRLTELPLASDGFRRARATVLGDQGSRGITHEDLVAVYACATRLAQTVRRQHPQFELGIDLDTAPGRLLDLVADRLVVHPEARQEILEAIDVPTRLSRVLDALTELLTQSAGAGPLS